MDSNKNYKYYAVEILDPLWEDFERFICIPASWIRIKESDQRILVSFPLAEEVSVTKRRVKDGEELSESWTILAADIKLGADSYDEANNCITMLQNRLLQEPSYAEIIKERESSTSFENESPASSLNRDFELIASQDIITEDTLCADLNKDIVTEQTEAMDVGEAINEKVDTPPQLLRDKQLSFTITRFGLNRSEEDHSVAISNYSNNKTHEEHVDDNNPKKNNVLSTEDIIKLIFETDFLEQFKTQHSSLKEDLIKMDKIRNDCINLISIMKKIIELLENYKKCYIDQPNIITTEDITDIDLEETEQDQGLTNEEAKTNTTQGEQESHDTHDTDVVDEMIDDEKNIQNMQQKKRRLMKQFTLPEEHNENDSRWTLRYPKKKPGLVELIPYSRIYVDETRLQNCKRNSNDVRTFARLLLVEIFSDNALSVCSLTGRIAYPYRSEEYLQRPGLDEHARMVLFNYVEEYAEERNWPKLDDNCVTYSVRNKLREIRAKGYK